MAPKKKQEKMALGDFLTNQSLGSWADEMDSQPLPAPSSNAYSMRDRGGDGERRGFNQPSWESARSGAGAMGGGASSGMGGGDSFDRPRYDREEIPFPTKPPYTAHLGNLDYNVTSVDVEEFLAECSVTTVRIMEDKIDRKPKGFGYVEFGSPEGLQKALNKSESSFMGRNIKISLADPPKNDRPEQTRDFSDWSRRGPLPDLPSQGRQPSRGFAGGRNFDNASDAGGERKSSFFEGDGKVRDFGNWERKGPLSPAPGAGPPVRDGGRLRDAGDPRERRGSPAGWGEGREARDGQSDAGSRPPRREFEPRPVAERVPTAAETDSQWRTKMRPDPSPAPTPDVSTPASPAQDAPKERPRLNLTKRTVSTAEPGSATTPSGDAKASPFGAARPIDTQQREREIEEKRELAVRQKKEADDKAREEKAARDATARAARGDRADRGQNEEGEKVTSPTGERPRGDQRRPSRQQQTGGKPQAKENGEGAAPAAKPSFSILQREDGDEASVDGDAVDASANGNIVDDKETKPQEVVVPAGGSAETTAEEMEDDGWSTVAAKPKNNRRGGARALAS